MGPLGLIKAVLSLLALSGQSLIPRPQALYPLGGLGATVAANSPFACIDTEEFMDFLASPEFWLALGQIIIIDILLGGDNAVVIALACRKLPPAQRTKGIIWGTAGAIVLRVILIAFAMTLLALLGLLISIPIIVWGSQLVIKLMERFPMIITAGGMLLGWIAGGMLVTDPAFSNPDKWQWMLKLPQTDMIKYGASVAGALLVLLAGKIIVARRAAAAPAEQQG